jgi:hypothetical protein
MIEAWDVAGLTEADWTRHSLDIKIRLAAAPYLDGWGYDLSSPKVLYELPAAMFAGGIVWTTGTKRTNCSTLTTSLLTSVRPDAPWTSREYGDLQVYADRLPDEPDAPIAAVVRMGIGQQVEALTAGAWHLVQGWRTFDPQTPRYSGHAFLVLADDAGDGILVLEASSLAGGPRYRRTTWAGLVGEYPAGVFVAVLFGP